MSSPSESFQPFGAARCKHNSNGLCRKCNTDTYCTSKWIYRIQLGTLFKAIFYLQSAVSFMILRSALAYTKLYAVHCQICSSTPVHTPTCIYIYIYSLSGSQSHHCLGNNHRSRLLLFPKNYQTSFTFYRKELSLRQCTKPDIYCYAKSHCSSGSINSPIIDSPIVSVHIPMHRNTTRTTI